MGHRHRSFVADMKDCCKTVWTHLKLRLGQMHFLEVICLLWGGNIKSSFDPYPYLHV